MGDTIWKDGAPWEPGALAADIIRFIAEEVARQLQAILDARPSPTLDSRSGGKV